MEALAHDLLSAWRTVWRSRSAVGLIIALVAGGIGLNTAIFALLDRMVLRKIAVPEPDRLIHINALSRGFREPVPYPILLRLRERSDLFAGVSGWLDQVLPVDVSGETRPALVVRVDPHFYGVIGARPQMGRLLAPDERGPVAVISDQFWTTRFSRDAGVLGRTVRVEDTAVTIVGVMPAEFSGMIANTSCDLTVPLEAFKVSRLETVARLRPGVALESARSQVQSAWAQLVRETVPPGRSTGNWISDVGSAVNVESASHGTFLWRSQYERPLVLLLGMGIALLLIVCANLASLLLAHGLSRRKEIAIKMALGATRRRLRCQLLLESLILASAGGVLGMLVARCGTELGVNFFPSGNVPFDYGANSRALGFAAILSFCATMAFGLVPALLNTRIAVADAMRGGVIPRGAAMRRGLLFVQVAVSTILVAGSLLFGTTVARLAGEPAGFQRENLLVLTVQGKSRNTQLTREYFDELLRRLRSIPGVEYVTLANQLPMQYPTFGKTGAVSASGETWVTAEAHCIFPDYFATLGTRILQGRTFGSHDGKAIILNQRLGGLLFGMEGGIGRAIRRKEDKKETDRVVVGVAPDIKYGSPRDPAAPAYYVPCLDEWTPEQAGAYSIAIALRGVGPDTEPAARRAIDDLGKQCIFQTRSMSEFARQRTLLERLLAAFTSVFGAMTLALVALGTYSLLAFIVASRTREFGIRLAIGAQRRNIIALVAREVLVVIGMGVGVGLICAASATKLFASILYGVRPMDPIVFASAAVFLLVFAAGAALVPTRRALAIEPVNALRHE